MGRPTQTFPTRENRRNFIIMKKNNIFRHELNESIQATAAMNCLKNRNKHQHNEGFLMTAGIWVLKKIVFHLVMKAIKKYGSQIDFSKVMDSVANGLAEQKGALQKAVGKAVNGWQDLPEKYKNQITELAKEKFNELKTAAGEKINQLTSKGQPQLAAQEQEEEVDVYELALEVAQKHARKIARMTEQNACGVLMRELCKLTNRDFDSLDEEGDFDYYQDAALYGYDSVVGYDEEEELDIEGSRAAYYSQDEPDYNDDSHGIRLILNMLMKRGDITKNDIPRVQEQIKSMLDANGLWIGDDDHEAERFIEMYWDNQEQEEDGINKGGMHNLVQVGHIMNTPSLLDKLDTEYFSDLEEQEAYYENFRAIAELVADQIDRENGKDIDNNMDTLFEIVREVWNNNPDDLYIWDFDDVQEDACYKFFDKYYETIKNEYLKREHNNIMAATHDDLFASEQEEDFDDAEDFISNVVNLMEDEGMINDSQWDEAYYTVEEMVQSNPEMLQYPSYMQFLNVFGDDILSKLGGGF